MDDKGVVIDTNIFIEHLRAKDKENTSLSQLNEEKTWYVSVISVFELYVGATSLQKKQDVEILLTNIHILGMNEDIAKIAAEIAINLKQKHQIIEFRDIFIAATALYYNMPIISLNRNHFQRIENLQLL